jgi:integrase
MASLLLTPTIVKNTTCAPDKQKDDLFDTGCKGLLLEIRCTGGRTFYLRYSDNRGKQRQYRIGDATAIPLAQARHKATELRGQIALGNDPSAQKAVLRAVPTFADFAADRYMPFVKGYKKSWNSDDSYLRNHLLPVFGKKHLDEIAKHEVIAFHHGMRAKGFALGTANRCLILLRYVMNLAVRWEIPGMTKNPTKDVPLFEDPHNKERYLSETEAQTLYRAVQASRNPMLQYIIPMLILTGARKREVLDAKWSELDLERRQWRVSVTKAGKPRYVPLSDGVVQMLSTMPHDNHTWVFPNPKTGKPYVSIFISWDTARKQAGLADVRIHDLRHSFASFLVNAGRSLYEVQKILGHTQIKTTQRYAHLSQDTLIDAANVVPFTMDLPIVAMVKAGSSGLVLGLR